MRPSVMPLSVGSSSATASLSSGIWTKSDSIVRPNDGSRLKWIWTGAWSKNSLLRILRVEDAAADAGGQVADGNAEERHDEVVEHELGRQFLVGAGPSASRRRSSAARPSCRHGSSGHRRRRGPCRFGAPAVGLDQVLEADPLDRARAEARRRDEAEVVDRLARHAGEHAGAERDRHGRAESRTRRPPSCESGRGRRSRSGRRGVGDLEVVEAARR